MRKGEGHRARHPSVPLDRTLEASPRHAVVTLSVWLRCPVGTKRDAGRRPTPGDERVSWLRTHFDGTGMSPNAAGQALREPHAGRVSVGEHRSREAKLDSR